MLLMDEGLKALTDALAVSDDAAFGYAVRPHLPAALHEITELWKLRDKLSEMMQRDIERKVRGEPSLEERLAAAEKDRDDARETLVRMNFNRLEVEAALIERAEKAEAALAAVKPKLKDRWAFPNGPTIKTQAELRGEPVPVGKTVGELKAMGYQINWDFADCVTLIADPESPTGYTFVTSIANLDAAMAVDPKGVESAYFTWFEDGKEQFSLIRVTTAGWLRKHKLQTTINPLMPDWAVVDRFSTDKDGYIRLMLFARPRTVAPSAKAFDLENKRRAAAGLPKMEDWRCPGVVRSFVRAMTGDWKEVISNAVDSGMVAHHFALAIEDDLDEVAAGEQVRGDEPPEEP